MIATPFESGVRRLAGEMPSPRRGEFALVLEHLLGRIQTRVAFLRESLPAEQHDNGLSAV